jgi:hypothetical protein
MTEPLTDIDSEFYEIVGRVASDWAMLELLVNDCNWALAGVSYGFGAAITAQIYTLDGRLKALAAILHLRKEEGLATKINAFSKKARGASEKRNRMVHDTWWSADGEAKQVVITADRKLHFAIEDRDIAKARADHKVIEDVISEFSSIREFIRARLPSLPGTHRLAVQATFLPHDPKQTQATQTQTQLPPPRSSQG